MFVEDTFLSSLDRLSVRSIHSIKKGSILGCIATLAFVALAIVIFIGPVVLYFNGDFVQGKFFSIKQQTLQLYTGCDFKMSISFYSKKTNQLINHKQLSNLLNIRTFYISPSGQTFYAQVQQCSDEYHSEMENKKQTFSPPDCFIVPNGLGFNSETIDGYSSVFGFMMEPYCQDPFLCTFSYSNTSNISKQRQDFFKNHYYTFRFTGNYIDKAGKLKKKFYEIYSTQLEGDNIIIPRMWAILQTQMTYMDDSIMPWRNNKTLMYVNWYGQTSGVNLNSFNLESLGASCFLTVIPIQNVSYREYKKLDWLLGMLGGGIFCLFLIFSAVCNSFSRIKQQLDYQNETILVKQDIKSQILTRRKGCSLTQVCKYLVQFYLPCFGKNNKIKQRANKIFDIAQIVKKLKVSKKNLQWKANTPEFEIKKLNFHSQPSDEMNADPLYQIPEKDLENIKSCQNVNSAYSNDPTLLSISQLSLKEGEQFENKPDEIWNKELEYPRTKIINFNLPRVNTKCGKLCKNARKYLSKFIQLFDFFGSKPKLIANPENYSFFGCLLFLIIGVLSILTFALTLKNMGVTKVYWDNIYKEPEQQSITMTSGKQLRTIVCFSPQVIRNNLVTGKNRVLDIKFYQYKRNINKQEVTEYDVIPLKGQSSTYFDPNGQFYNNNDLSSCFRPQNNKQFFVYGDSNSDSEAYYGFIIKPYCFGDSIYCQRIKATSYKNFYDFLNQNQIKFYLPDARYYPEKGKIVISPLSASLTPSSVNMNITRPIQHYFSLDTIQLVDNWATWMLGEFPKPKSKTLTANFQTTQTYRTSKDESIPYYKTKFLVSGRVLRYIFDSYKLDFLFQIIGGSFVFFYFFLAWIGKIYNQNKIKAKLAEALYDEKSGCLSVFKAYLHSTRIPCFRNQILSKIQADIDCTRIAKSVDNLYRLSVRDVGESQLEKDLSLIYLKQTIKADEDIVIKEANLQEDDEEDDETDFFEDWTEKQNLEAFKKKGSKIVNQSDMKQDINRQQDERERFDQVKQQNVYPSKKFSTCQNFVNNYNLFSVKDQFLLNGKRQVKSVCGGLCCIALFIFICFLTSNFITVYLSKWHRVSTEVITDQSSAIRRIDLQAGSNFKLAVSFSRADNYQFLDIGAQRSEIGIAITKYKARKSNGIVVQDILGDYQLESCSSNYFDGFLSHFNKQQYQKNLNKAYCVPNNLSFALYGSSDDEERQFFSVRIYNKYGYNNTEGIKKLDDLLTNYIPVFHVSSLVLNFEPTNEGRIQFEKQVCKQTFKNEYVNKFSANINMTLVKNIVYLDSSINPSAILPQTSSYQAKLRSLDNFQNYYTDNFDRFYKVNFYAEESYVKHTVKTFKINEAFGIIGGCIAILFLGFGIFPKSFNEFKMRYKIGEKIYIIMGKVRTKFDKKKKRNDKIEEHEISFDYLSQSEIFLAWLQSYINFFKSSYTFKTLRRYALIESRISKDINIYQFMKRLTSYEDAMDKKEESIPNISKIYPKQIVILSKDNNNSIQLKTQLKRQEQLFRATKQNSFTQWELKTLLDAKTQGLRADRYFKMKWLHSFLGSDKQSTQKGGKLIEESDGLQERTSTLKQKKKMSSELDNSNSINVSNADLMKSSQRIEKEEEQSIVEI